MSLLADRLADLGYNVADLGSVVAGLGCHVVQLRCLVSVIGNAVSGDVHLLRSLGTANLILVWVALNNHWW
jgi:hypothetical protein